MFSCIIFLKEKSYGPCKKSSSMIFTLPVAVYRPYLPENTATNR